MTAASDSDTIASEPASKKILRTWLAPLVLLALSVVTIGTRYWVPTSLFWDENYHVTSAQKHIAGVMFMESHPPLGKMLIALGEVAVGSNSGLDTSALLRTDHVQQAELPPGYSFVGVRLASVVSMIAAVLLLYATLLAITGQRPARLRVRGAAGAGQCPGRACALQHARRYTTGFCAGRDLCTRH